MRIFLLLAALLILPIVATAAPTASLTCPSTAFVGEVVVCDGSASTNVNGQQGWSVKTFVDGTSPVDMDFGDNLGPYSKSKLLKSPHVYLAAGTYQVTLTVKDSAGATATATPQTIVVSAIPAATGGAIQTLTNQGSAAANYTALQAMVNSAFAANTVSQEIRITNGLQITGVLTAPAAAGNSYVSLRPTDISWMPSGLGRVTPAMASNMPKMTAPHGNGSPIHIFGVGRKYLRVLGIEFNKPQDLIMNSLLMIGSDGITSPSTYAQLPDHIIFDRCYFRGNATDDMTRAILLYGNDVSIINSYFTGFHDGGSDSQTLVVIDGKRQAFVNNHAEAYGENAMWGGAGTNIKFSATASSGTSTSATLSSVASLNVGDGISFMVSGNRGPWSASIVRSVAGNNITFDQITNQAGTPTAPDTTSGEVKYGSSPQDIFVARNYFYKNPAFRVGGPGYNGVFAVVKNSFELKHAMRVILVGNVIENMWGNQGQDGHTVLFTPRNQTCFLPAGVPDPIACPSQTNPWVMVRDVQFSHTRVKNIPDFFNILGTDNLNPPGTGAESGPSAFAQNITVEEVLIEGTDPAASGTGRLALIWPGTKNVTFSHNTQVNVAGGAWILSSAAPIGSVISNGLVVNNIGPHQTYGAFGDGLIANTFIANFFPDGFIRYNVLSDDFTTIGPNGESWTAPRGAPNYFPATINTNTFINLAGGNYRLKSDSPYKAGNATPAADGRDMGINVDDVEAATANTISGNWGTQQVTIITANLQHGEGTDSVTDFSRQVTTLAGADLIAVQERTTNETGWNASMAAAGLAEAVYRENDPSQGDGPAIWYSSSTVTVNQTYQTDLSNGFIGLVSSGSPNVDKAAVAAKVTVEGHQFYVVSTHLCWSACANSTGSQESTQREAQITTLLSWINSTLTGGLDIVLAGDMNFGPDYAKVGGGLIKSMITASYTDLWNTGITAGTATTPWGDRDVNGTVDMTPADLGTQTTGTRTHDTRRIDYIFLKQGAVTLSLSSISVPDSRATCPTALTLTGTFKECPAITFFDWDITDDQGVRASDHNPVRAVLNLSFSSSSVITCRWSASPPCQ